MQESCGTYNTVKPTRHKKITFVPLRFHLPPIILPATDRPSTAIAAPFKTEYFQIL
jgi:hypothetical protein